ncbi:hypothetical protein IWQ60_005454 [Tieghemiomyces parasiticus]|uniref:Uncharacterized protein n=1 Tax=Tieghemiomyces parasiticus TaxID=78921 RepID=A0A9W8A935_9FUNG|nr:hypothetical protein IWQ60_005454 [Tieghemiomyces parasiticus]
MYDTFRTLETIQLYREHYFPAIFTTTDDTTTSKPPLAVAAPSTPVQLRTPRFSQQDWADELTTSPYRGASPHIARLYGLPTAPPPNQSQDGMIRHPSRFVEALLADDQPSSSRPPQASVQTVQPAAPNATSAAATDTTMDFFDDLDDTDFEAIDQATDIAQLNLNAHSRQVEVEAAIRAAADRGESLVNLRRRFAELGDTGLNDVLDQRSVYTLAITSP